MSPPWQVMFDLETIGQNPGCAILSIGAVRFCPESGLIDADHFYNTIDLKNAMRAGLVSEPDTIIWWMRQSDGARRAVTMGEHALSGALHAFASWLSKTGAPKLWSHGASFDPPILAWAYRKLGIDLPWKFWNLRDTRTIFDLAGDIKIPRVEGTAHNALDDARNQAKAVITAYEKLALIKFAAAQPSAAATPVREPEDMPIDIAFRLSPEKVVTSVAMPPATEDGF